MAEDTEVDSETQLLLWLSLQFPYRFCNTSLFVGSCRIGSPWFSQMSQSFVLDLVRVRLDFSDGQGSERSTIADDRVRIVREQSTQEETLSQSKKATSFAQRGNFRRLRT